jgi:dTDP-4-dehydrorhamnose 3,5-epimerase-like enzyme
MPQFIDLPTHSSDAGYLSVFEKILPSGIKRVFYIYDVKAGERRAEHGHKKTWNALMCVSGSCHIFLINNEGIEFNFDLTNPAQCLLIEPGDWHMMDKFSSNAVLLVVSSEYYDKNDYFFERP